MYREAKLMTIYIALSRVKKSLLESQAFDSGISFEYFKKALTHFTENQAFFKDCIDPSFFIGLTCLTCTKPIYNAELDLNVVSDQQRVLLSRFVSYVGSRLKDKPNDNDMDIIRNILKYV